MRAFFFAGGFVSLWALLCPTSISILEAPHGLALWSSGAAVAGPPARDLYLRTEQAMKKIVLTTLAALFLGAFAGPQPATAEPESGTHADAHHHTKHQHKKQKPKHHNHKKKHKHHQASHQS